MLQKSANLGKRIMRVSHRNYDTMNPSEYISNYTNALLSKDWQRKKLKPMIEANHRSDDNLIIYSCPMMPVKNREELFKRTILSHQPDLLFIQYEPMPYITRQRFMAHKAALHGVLDYDIRGVKDLIHPYPHTWEEAVVNLIVLDMLHANQIHTKLDYTKGFATYSYPQVQEQRVHDNLREKFIEAITDHIIADQWSPYIDINSFIYMGLMGKHKVLLGDMPEILLRQILGNSISLEQAKDIFKFVLEHIKKTIDQQKGQVTIQNTMCSTTNQLFGHIFQQPRDLYLAALLKRVMQAATNVVAYVGAPHFVPLQNYWQPPPYGVNYTQATKIPQRIPNETPEMLIEKQAIFQILLDTKLWGQKYITNAFPYLTTDITDLSEKDHKYFKKTFFVNYKKYEAFRDSVVPREIFDRISSDFSDMMGSLNEGETREQLQ